MEYVGIAKEIISNIKRIIQGKDDQIENIVIALLVGGHVLIEDVPGVGKTTLAKALAHSIGCVYSRIQFTSDTLPSDVIGFSVYNMKTGEFEFHQGAIMSPIVLADEINRTSPKTQASLLEAMEENQVTVDGTCYHLPSPFLVMATQNPVDCVGTYPLPEAQLDRFLMKIRLGYPTKEFEIEMACNELEQVSVKELEPVTDAVMIQKMQEEVKKVKITREMISYIVDLVQATRESADFELGLSPRATLALMKAAQAKAYLSGRSFVIPDDVITMAESVTSHRVILSLEAKMAKRSSDRCIAKIIEKVPMPAL